MMVSAIILIKGSVLETTITLTWEEIAILTPARKGVLTTK
jgi:hypothetical protein